MSSQEIMPLSSAFEVSCDPLLDADTVFANTLKMVFEEYIRKENPANQGNKKQLIGDFKNKLTSGNDCVALKERIKEPNGNIDKYLNEAFKEFQNKITHQFPLGFGLSYDENVTRPN